MIPFGSRVSRLFLRDQVLCEDYSQLVAQFSPAFFQAACDELYLLVDQNSVSESEGGLVELMQFADVFSLYLNL